ncbi:MAG: hypothetical protein ACYST6_06015 [Planctomycetota bacterium]|jgi:hypothetical protein
MNHAQANPKGYEPAKKKRRISPLKITLLILCLLLALLLLKSLRAPLPVPKISVNYAAEWNRISKPPDYDQNQNAALDYQKATDFLVQAPDEISYSPIHWPGDMNEMLLKTLENWLRQNTDALAYLNRGSQKPYCWIEDFYIDDFLATGVPAVELASIRSLADLVGWQAKLNATKGQGEAAADQLIAGHRFASHFFGPKPILCQLVALSARAMVIRNSFLILNRHQFDPQTLDRFQGQLEQQFEMGQKLDFQYDRLATYDIIQRVFTDDGRGNGRLLPEAATMLVFSLPPYALGTQPGQIIKQKAWEYGNRAKSMWLRATGPDRKETVVMTDKLFDYYETLKNKTFWELRKNEVESKAKMDAITEDCIVLYWANTDYQLLELYQRTRAQEIALTATLAVLRFKQERGYYPEKLDELVLAGYLRELPADPFGDGALIYKRLGDNFTLYSFAEDCDDDGGTPSNWGHGEEGGDQVFWPVESAKK